MGTKSWATIKDDFEKWAKSLRRLAKETQLLFDFVERAVSAAKLAAARQDDRFVQLKDKDAKAIASKFREVIGKLGAADHRLIEDMRSISGRADDAALWINRAVETYDQILLAEASRSASDEGAEPQP